MKQAILRAGLPLALVFTGVGLPAFAGGLAAPVAEAPVAAPVAVTAPTVDWTGGWVGGKLGYGRGSNGTTDDNGATYGIAGGYDWDFGQWVAGAALDWDQTDIDLGTGTDNLDEIARLKFRVGADLGRTLVYATAGPAWASADISGTGLDDSGWYGGIGADYALNESWTIGGELLTNQFDNFGGTGTDLDATTAAVNLGFRF